MLYETYYKYKWHFQRIFVVCQVYWSFSLTHQAIKIAKNAKMYTKLTMINQQ